ncbi:MAG: ferredoxin III, nif-specific [Gammaproteobacteria bacterium]|nr:ferredoxin III, nif-specific [Gammaproteobacteria bacterium]
MTDLTLTLHPQGRAWVPQFVQAIDGARCIGCGRCFRVCGRGVLALMGVDDAGQHVPMAMGDDEEDGGEYEKKVMTIAHPEDCIGCGACGRICPKKCHTHGARAVED